MGVITINNLPYEVYGDEVGREVYFSAALRGAVYTAASPDERNRAHVTATRALDRQGWLGSRAVATQTLAHPRTGLAYRDGTIVSSDEVAPEIIAATYEMILSLLGDSNVETNSGAEAQVKRVKAGSAEVEFFETGSASDDAEILALPKTVNELVAQFLRSPTNSGRKVIAGGYVGGLNYTSPGVPDFGVN